VVASFACAALLVVAPVVTLLVAAPSIPIGGNPGDPEAGRQAFLVVYAAVVIGLVGAGLGFWAAVRHQRMLGFGAMVLCLFLLVVGSLRFLLT
jgi:hypothetical protein